MWVWQLGWSGSYPRLRAVCPVFAATDFMLVCHLKLLRFSTAFDVWDFIPSSGREYLGISSTGFFVPDSLSDVQTVSEH